MIKSSDPSDHKTANLRGLSASTGIIKKHNAKHAIAPSKHIPKINSLSQYESLNHSGSSTVSSCAVAATFGETLLVSDVELKNPNRPLLELLDEEADGSVVGKRMRSFCLKGFKSEILFIKLEAPFPLVDDDEGA